MIRLNKYLIFAIFIIFTILILIPIFLKLFTGYFIGDDPFEYLLTGNAILHKNLNNSQYLYSFPFLPLIYISVIMLVKDPYWIAFISNVFSGIFFIFLTFSFLLFIRSLKFQKLTQMLSILFFGFSTMLMTEIGWGGQAQFLSLSFIFLALSIYFKNFERLNFLRIFIISTLVLLSVLTEPYSAVYGSTFLFLSIVTMIKNRRLKFEVLLAIITFFLIGLAILSYLYIPDNTTGVRIEPLILALTSINFGIIFFNLSNSNHIIFLIYILMLMLLIALYFSVRLSKNKYYSKILTISLISLLPYLLITPSAYPERLVYFFYVPLSLYFAYIFDSILKEIITDNPITIRNFKHLASKNQILKLIAIIILICLVIANIPLGYAEYQKSLTFYQRPQSIMNAGLWLKNNSLENQSILDVDLSAWALSYFSERNIYDVQGLKYFIKTNQIQNSIYSNVMAYSQYYVSAGNFYILDFPAQSDQPSPLILFYSYPSLVPLLYLNDTLTTIKTDSSSTVYNLLNSSIINEVSKTFINHTYNFSNFSVSKKIYAVPNSSQIRIVFNYSFKNHTFPKYVNIPIFEGNVSSYMHSGVTENRLSNSSMVYNVNLKNSDTLQSLKTRIYFNVSAGYLKAEPLFYNHKFQLVNNITFHNSVNNLTVTISVSVPGYKFSYYQINYTKALFDKFNIAYAVMSTYTNDSIALRFFRDPNFSLVYDSHNILIYKRI